MQGISRSLLVEIITSLGFTQRRSKATGTISSWRKTNEETLRVSIPNEDTIAPYNAYLILCECGLDHREAKERLGIGTHEWVL